MAQLLSPSGPTQAVDHAMWPPSSPVQEMESTPGPWYSTIAPVPPFTVRIPATFKITSLGEVQPESEPVSFTPIT